MNLEKLLFTFIYCWCTVLTLGMFACMSVSGMRVDCDVLIESSR